MECAKTNKGGVESIPFEIKVLACLRYMGRGEVWDTIVELCNDIPSVTTLQNFSPKFCKEMKNTYKEGYIHPPRTETEIGSTLQRSALRGIAGCIGFMDGVHVHWGAAPTQWFYFCKGKCPYATVGWQCTVNHQRRFISVMDAQMGSITDATACKSDPFVRELRTNPLYKDFSYDLYDSQGVIYTEKGLWVSVDGGYLRVPQLLVGNPQCLHLYMNYWTHFMESERKHVECAFGILKSRFRVLKLPIRLCEFEHINDMFITCCILHNMCLDFDGGDDGWHLGGVEKKKNHRGDLLNHRYREGTDGYFSNDENHQLYTFENFDYDLIPQTDYTVVGNEVYQVLGSEQDTSDYKSKVSKQAHNFYYMYKNNQINFDV